jgi:hypothetical protein
MTTRSRMMKKPSRRTTTQLMVVSPTMKSMKSVLVPLPTLSLKMKMMKLPLAIARLLLSEWSSLQKMKSVR